MAKKPIKLAVAGLGRSGWDIHVAGVRGDDRYRIVAVMDPLAKRRTEAAAEFACETYDDYGKMLRATDADVVTVATPSAFHGPQTIAALKAGKHVVVEKPLSTSVREADRMIAAAATCKRHLMIHQNYRLFPSCTFMLTLVKSGKLGKLTHLAFNSSSYSRRNDWQCLRANAGGLLNNHGTHALDQLLTLVRSPIKDVLCDMKHISDAGDVEDQVTILLRAENGVTIGVNISTAAATVEQAPEWTILGSSGAATIANGKAHLKYYDPKKAPKIRVRKTTAVDGRKYGNDDVLPWVEEACDAIGPDPGSFYDAVYATVRQRKKFIVQPSEVREMMRVIDICRKQNPAFPGR